ncbi:hypothetical protein, partial [Bacteroides heparinolyticus]|uniref:hypothetical protein n=1 Tax=Prevotella heparinolytica TaxID=28113 RepID=UPI0035A0AC10
AALCHASGDGSAHVSGSDNRYFHTRFFSENLFRLYWGNLFKALKTDSKCVVLTANIVIYTLRSSG